MAATEVAPAAQVLSLTVYVEESMDVGIKEIRNEIRYIQTVIF